MSNRINDKEKMKERLYNQISKMNILIEQKKQKITTIEKDYPNEKVKVDDYNTRKRRIENVNQCFRDEWILTLKELDSLCKIIRNRQPHLNELTSENINEGLQFPDALAFGRLHVSYLNWKGYIPRLVTFPLNCSIWASDRSIEQQKLIHQLLLRVLYCLPIGSVEIVVADPLRLGKSIKPFLSLLNVKKLFPNQRVLTRSDELENTLSDLMDYVEELIQNKFKGEIKNWSDYNSVNIDNPLLYKFIILYGVPDQLTDKGLWYLTRILEHGPICGLLPILTINEEQLIEKRFTGIRNALGKFSKRIDSIASVELEDKIDCEFVVKEEEEFWPNQSNLIDVLSLIAEKYKFSARFSKKMEDLWSEIECWKTNSIQGLNVPIGWTREMGVVNFNLGAVNSEHHVLLAGRSGSGKSNLLHIIIHSLCHYYSPEELSIYLLDYKQGTEFSTYATPPLPHAKLVATESDPEYGVTVLSHLKEELERRAQEFKSKSVKDFYEFREINNISLPRILLIIDEFQILFSENRQIGEQAEKILNSLLRQGRAYGIHVLLATQTLKGIQSLSMGQLISQIGCRIALACSEEDSAMILSNSNWEASKLSSPPEGIINNSNGAKSANQIFLIPFADRIQCKIHLEELYNFSKKIGFVDSTKIFSGSHLPKMPEFDLFSFNSGNAIQLQLGLQLSYEEIPLTVSLNNRSSANLLVSGYNDVIHNGLLFSILKSLCLSEMVDEIFYFSLLQNKSSFMSSCMDDLKKELVFEYNSIDELDLLTMINDFHKTKKVLIIDGLESIKDFHSGASSFRPLKKDEAPSPLDNIKKFLEEGPPNGTFVIAFADNWRRCNTVCKDLVNYFDLRVGFSMNEDDASSFVSGGIGKLRGLETENRAIFTDRLKNQIYWFRPYILGDE